LSGFPAFHTGLLTLLPFRERFIAPKPLRFTAKDMPQVSPCYFSASLPAWKSRENESELKTSGPMSRRAMRESSIHRGVSQTATWAASSLGPMA